MTGQAGSGYPTRALAALLGGLVAARLSLAPLGLNIMLSPSDALAPVYLVLAWSAGGRPVVPEAPWRIGLLFGALTLWLLVSLLRGAEAQGHWIAWAAVNKVGGWAVLGIYLAAGLTIAGRPGDREMFIKALLITTAVTTAAAMVAYFFLPVGNPLLSRILMRDNNRFAGLTGNPNAFAFLAACCLMVQMALVREGLPWSRRRGEAVTALCACGLVFGFSRSAWAGALAGAAVLMAVGRWDWRAAGKAVIAAAVATTVLTQLPARLFPSGAGYFTTTYLTQPDKGVTALADTGVQERLAVTMSAIEDWLAEPGLGIGLGVYVDRQVQAGNVAPATIHNTLLWLLVETGAVGATLAVALFLAVTIRLWKGRRSPLAAAVLAVTIVFAGISLFNELLYQRILWCLVGIGLGCAAITRREAA